MIDPQFFDNLTKKLSMALPSSLIEMQEELQKNFKVILQNAFAKLDLVTREEYEIHKKVLQRSREKIEQLEQKIANLENNLP